MVKSAAIHVNRKLISANIGLSKKANVNTEHPPGYVISLEPETNYMYLYLTSARTVIDT